MILRVVTHSGADEQIEVESYDPIALNEQINNIELSTVIIGNQIFSRIDIKHVKPIEENL